MAQITRKGGDGRMKHITIVCSSGLGTSLMVKILLERMLREWGLQAKVSNTDQSSIKTENSDLVIGAKQIIASIDLGSTIECIGLENLVDPQHLREKLQNSPTFQKWLKE
jgi:ascorbate PTS system EIIB component